MCWSAVICASLATKTDLDGVRAQGEFGVSAVRCAFVVCVFTEGMFVTVVYEVIFFFTRVCCLLSVLGASLFPRVPWQRPALSFPLCILLTLAAVSLPQTDKTRLNRTHTCTLWCTEVLNQHTLHAHIQKSKTGEEFWTRSLCST